MELLKSAKIAGATVTRRALSFLAALALEQNEPHLAFEMVDIKQPSNLSENIKLIALLRMKQIDKIFEYLRSVLREDNPSLTNPRRTPQKQFFSDFVSVIKKIEKLS